MADESDRHFVAYHNTERMGRGFGDGDPFRIFTNKPVGAVKGGTIWVIVGAEQNPRKFSLGSVFQATEIGDATDAGFKHFIAGEGTAFQPPIPLNDLEWFADFMKSMNRFQFGVQRLQNEEHIRLLRTLTESV